MGHPEWFLSSKNGKINCIIILGVRVRVDTDLTHLCYQPWRNKTLSWYLLDGKPFSLKYPFCGTPFRYEIILGTFLSKHLDHVLTRFLANSWLGHLQVKHTCNLIKTKRCLAWFYKLYLCVQRISRLKLYSVPKIQSVVRVQTLFFVAKQK